MSAKKKSTTESVLRWLHYALLGMTVRAIAAKETKEGRPVGKSTVGYALKGVNARRDTLSNAVIQDYLNNPRYSPHKPELMEWLQYSIVQAHSHYGIMSDRAVQAATIAGSRFENIELANDYLCYLRGELSGQNEIVIDSLAEAVLNRFPGAQVICNAAPESLHNEFYQSLLGGTMQEPLIVSRLAQVMQAVRSANLQSRSGLTIAVIPSITEPAVVFGLRVTFSDGSTSQHLQHLGSLSNYQAGDRVLVATTEEGEGVIVGVLYPRVEAPSYTLTPPEEGVPRMPLSGVDPAPTVGAVVLPGNEPTLPPYPQG